MKVSDRLPEATLLHMGDNGPEAVELTDLTGGKKVVIFGMPGAFTGTCTTAHLPSLIRTADDFRKKGVDELLVIVVNDVFVAAEWARQTGARDAGIKVLADADASFTKAAGLAFTASTVGFFDRTQRCAIYAENGTVRVINREEERGVCNMTAGETLLEAV